MSQRVNQKRMETQFNGTALTDHVRGSGFNTCAKRWGRITYIWAYWKYKFITVIRVVICLLNIQTYRKTYLWCWVQDILGSEISIPFFLAQKPCLGKSTSRRSPNWQRKELKSRQKHPIEMVKWKGVLNSVLDIAVPWSFWCYTIP